MFSLKGTTDRLNFDPDDRYDYALQFKNLKRKDYENFVFSDEFISANSKLYRKLSYNEKS